MRLATFDDDRIGVVRGDSVIDITEQLDDTHHGGWSRMRRLISGWDAAKAASLTDGMPVAPLSTVTLRAPIPDPSKILAAPVNYRDHQTEMQQDWHVSGLGLFLKAPSSVADPGSTVLLPYHDRRFDQEGELGCIIGRRARRVSPEEALSHVFGYTGAFDITMRGGEDRSTRKSFESFTPLGPWIVTSDEFGDPDDVDLRCWVSGTLRQHANTRDLIWGVAQLISYASWISPLEPGDVLITGTPAGVGPLADGDTIRLELARLGAPLEVTVSDRGSVASHTDGKDRGPVPPPPR
jgi:2-keto-4-pentenoate hydratase/2-oxohepta-3-ene-1,7-dioic acid hydratase in catechol pathway